MESGGPSTDCSTLTSTPSTYSGPDPECERCGMLERRFRDPETVNPYLYLANWATHHLTDHRTQAGPRRGCADCDKFSKPSNCVHPVIWQRWANSHFMQCQLAARSAPPSPDAAHAAASSSGARVAANRGTVAALAGELPPSAAGSHPLDHDDHRGIVLSNLDVTSRALPPAGARAFALLGLLPGDTFDAHVVSAECPVDETRQHFTTSLAMYVDVHTPGTSSASTRLGAGEAELPVGQ